MAELTAIGKQLGKVCWDPGHYKNANRIPAPYNTTPARKAFSEGNNNLDTVLGLMKEIPGSFSTRLNGTDLSFPARAKKAADGHADTEISFHSNWSVHDPDKRILNHGVVRVIRSVRRPGDQALGEAIANAIVAEFPELHLKAVCNTKRSTDSAEYDWYGMLYNPIKYGMKHAFIVENGYHIDWCDYMPIEEFRKRVIRAYDKLIYLPDGGTVVVPPPSDTTQYTRYTVIKNDTPWKVAKKHGLPGKDFVRIKFEKTGKNIDGDDVIIAGQILLVPKK